MSVEFDHYIDSDKKWWCHFDDDNYVNIPRLLSLLQHYDPMYDWYLGKTSIKHPLEIDDREFKVRKKSPHEKLYILIIAKFLTKKSK